MQVPRPVVSVPPAALLAPVMRGLRLPPPVAVTLLAPPWSHATYRVQLENGGEVLLRRPLAWTGRDTLQQERAALTLLRGVAEVPVVRAYEILPAGLLPWPAAVSARLPGTPADRVLAAAPQQAERVAEALGVAMAVVAERTAGAAFGTVADGGRFVPRRGTWRDEVAARVAEGLLATRAGGTGLGPLTTRLEERLDAELPALDSARTFALVHGDPSPGNLLVGEDGATLTGWIDWEGAVLGDPLVEWAALLAQPDAILAAVVRGYGPERVRALLDGDGGARLAVYALADGVARTAFAASPLFDGDTGARRAAVLARAHDVVADLLSAPRRAEERLERALDASAGAPWNAWRPVPAAFLLRRALCRLGGAPALPIASAQPLADALAAVRLGWVAQAARLIDALPPLACPAPAEPIRDRGAWRTALALHAAHGGPRTLALALLHLGLAAVDALGDTVDDGVLRGLEALVRALAAHERSGDERLPPALRLTHAVRGLAAATALGLDRASELRRQVEEAWDVASGGARSSSDEALDAVVAAEGGRAPRPGRASLLDALGTVPADQLPDAPVALLRLALP